MRYVITHSCALQVVSWICGPVTGCALLDPYHCQLFCESSKDSKNVTDTLKVSFWFCFPASTMCIYNDMRSGICFAHHILSKIFFLTFKTWFIVNFFYYSVYRATSQNHDRIIVHQKPQIKRWKAYTALCLQCVVGFSMTEFTLRRVNYAIKG